MSRQMEAPDGAEHRPPAWTRAWARGRDVLLRIPPRALWLTAVAAALTAGAVGTARGWRSGGSYGLELGLPHARAHRAPLR